ncbi:hypothetical protein [Undibacterium sp. Di24W]|uniref:hypothetical protein n=1 Tax=Undibacterium sp. Di24W TaxID=3413033 RepID=UPI003BF39F20
MKIPFSAYRPSFKLNLPTFVFSAILLSLLSGCGGSSSGSASPSTNPGTSTVSLTISATSNEVYAGGVPVSLTVSKSQGSGTVNWSLNNSSLGSLSATSGDTIQYTPPSPQSLGGANSVTITASIGSVSQSLTLPIQSRARIEFVAGDIGGMGNIDGVGAGARFNLPKNLVVDKDGTIFVCDTGNGLIRKITTAGVVTTFAAFDSPRALTVDRDGKLYVIDGKNKLIRSITSQGVISTLPTQIALKADAELKDLVVDSLGNLFVMENELIHRITKSGELSVFAGKSNELGLLDGKGGNARFTSLEGIVVDKENNLFVLDDVAIRKITPEGQVTTLDFAPARSKGGGIAIDPAGNVFVTNVGGAGLTLRRLSKNGQANFLDTQMDLSSIGLAKIAIGDNGQIVLADTRNHRVMIINVQSNYAEVRPFAGHIRSWYNAIKPNPNSLVSPSLIPFDGIGVNAQFYYPPQLAASNGELFSYEVPAGVVRDKIFSRISANGELTRLPGVRGDSFDYLDNPPTRGFVADTKGNLYLASIDKIYRIGPSGTAIALMTLNYSEAPVELAIDAQDRLYFAIANAVFRFSPETGAILIAGQIGKSEYIDANGAAARFSQINGLHVSRDGSIYVTDKNVLRKIDTSANVTTVAGRFGEAGVIDAAGTNARLDEPGSITSDLSGNIYVADSSPYKLDSTNTYVLGKNHTVRKISPTGVVTTIAGVAGKFGIGLSTFPNTLGRINDIQFVAPNTLYISSEYSVLKMNLTN